MDPPAAERGAMTSQRGSRASHGESYVPEATLYLIGDPRKCTGCLSCMLVCAVAHEGRAQLQTALVILIVEDRFGSYRLDISLGTGGSAKTPAASPPVPTAR